jgi:NAD dependent epimerase/dehydratase family enzyme
MSTMLLDSARVKPAVALANGYTFKHPELRDALAACV